MKFLFSILFLFSVLCANAQTVAPASELLNAAYKQADVEHKNVIMIFHASWCGWCHKMDSSLNDIACKKYFDKNYVIVHLTVKESDDKKMLENPGAEELLTKYNGDKQGVPFWLVMNKDGGLLADSRMESGDNMGCPSEENEVAAFIKILKQTSSLNDKELKIIAERFRKNAVSNPWLNE